MARRVVRRWAGSLAEIIAGSKRGWPANLGWGIYWSLCGAVPYCTYALLLYLFRGAKPFLENDSTLPTVLSGYLLGALAVGVLLGSLRPLARWWWGSALLGLICASAVFVGLRIASDGLYNWTQRDLWTLVNFSVIFGPASGIILRRWWRRLKAELS